MTIDINEAARLLETAWNTRKPIPALRSRIASADLEAAYAVQEVNTQKWLASGRRLVGRKIGLTSIAVQSQLGVDQPDFGMLFDDMAVGEGARIPAGALIQPKVEAEVALVLGRDLPHERHTFADLIRAVDFALPAIEIVDSRIENWDIGLFDTVADNASSGLFVVGSRPVRLGDFDIARCGMEMKKGADVVSSGNGRACLGNPLNAAVWLANVLTRLGRPLAAGDLILTGALGPMVAVQANERYDVEIQGLGSVSAAFE